MRRRLGRWAGAWSVATAAVLLVSTTGLALCAGAVAVAVRYSTARSWCNIQYSMAQCMAQNSVQYMVDSTASDSRVTGTVQV